MKCPTGCGTRPLIGRHPLHGLTNHLNRCSNAWTWTLSWRLNRASLKKGPEDDAVHGVKGGKKKGGKKMENEIEGVSYLEFDTFMKVNLRVGRIISVDDHPNADKLYVVKLDDGTGGERTICAGLKAFYQPDEMEGKLVVFVENLKPRPLRGVTSEGMMLAADDGEGHVRLITVDGDIRTGSQVR